MLSRRVALLGLGSLTFVQATHARVEPVPTLAYVAAKDANPKRLDIFKKGLAELGYAEGKNIRIEYHEAVLDADYDGVVADVIERKVDIILAANVAATRAAARATKTIPIVMMAVFDPVGIGVVKSLERSGTNVTGTTMYAPQLIGERLRILKRLVPQLKKVAMALNGHNVNNAAQFDVLRSEAQKIGIAVQQLDIRTPEDVDAAFEKTLGLGIQGLTNAVDSFINSRRFALAAGAAKQKMPFVFSDVEYVMAGGLIALGPGHYEGYHDAAEYVDKILRGANPADLPIAGPTEFTMSANRTAFKNLGLSLPPDLADRVSEWID